ncbi:hypothetical protein BN2476_960094 [Paraburkholderia piptadeniae]|uniref:Uncharacterized protein n=1 Tax=Paraburkholderia piptadeniae TaxID=1701573 RepID=A0A1N7STY6_9BURK|nr:hypothetical protein BN2476_960094 [Paraburkholderia piptadeniae]
MRKRYRADPLARLWNILSGYLASEIRSSAIRLRVFRSLRAAILYWTLGFGGVASTTNRVVGGSK